MTGAREDQSRPPGAVVGVVKKKGSKSGQENIGHGTHWKEREREGWFYAIIDGDHFCWSVQY